MPNHADYYELLHLQPDAPPALIKASYRTLMQKLKMHPDLGGEADLAGQLNNAYDTLSDPDLRAQYDFTRHRSANNSENGSTTTRASGPSAGQKRPPQATPSPPRVMWHKADSKSAAQCRFCSTPHSFHTYPPRGALCNGCDCPLAPAGTRELLMGERRILERLDIERHIQYRSVPGGAMRHASTTDLSLCGLKFSANDNLISNQLIQIQSPFCHALGRIAHLAGDSTTQQKFGVEFVTLCFPQTSGSLVSTHA